MRQQWRRYLLTLSFALGATSIVLGQDPTFTTIDFPGSIGTQSWGINARGDVVGFYTSADKASRGFLKSGDRYTAIDYPGAALTLVNGIDSQGDIVGEYALTASGPHHGFLRSQDGHLTVIDYPGATTTSAIGIDARGDIVGLYALADNINHGFLRSGDRFTSFDFPGTASTVPNGINAQGDIVGGYSSAGVSHGFLLSNGEFSSFHFPDAAFTTATGINPGGDIVGRYRDSGGVNHGFLLVDGQFSTIDFPGATYTGATAIDPAGNILGRYMVAGVSHGFLLRPERPQQRYTITDLGAVGAPPGQPFFIANNGLTSGSVGFPDGTEHAVLWYKGWRGDFGKPGLGGANSVSFGVNQRGQAVGEAETSTSDPNGEDFCGFNALGLPSRGRTCLPFLWQSGVMTPLPTLGGNNGVANMINNRGEAAGWAENTTRDPVCPAPQVLQFKPVIWENGKIQELSTVAGDREGIALGINDNGQAVGSSGGCTNFNPISLVSLVPLHALLWEKGTVTDLGGLGGTGNGNGNVAVDLNNKGQVVGNSDLPGDTTFHGFLWTKETGMQDLGTLPGDVNSAAIGINDAGEVVGVSLDASFNTRAFVWQNGVMSDLNTLIPANSPLFLITACSINSRGEIIGIAVEKSSGNVHGYLATPSGGAGIESAAPAVQGVSGPMVLSDDARKQLQRQLRLGRIGVGLMGPR